MPNLIDVKEAAKLLDVSVSLIYKLSEAGELPHLKIGGSLKFNVPSLEKWIEKKVKGC